MRQIPAEATASENHGPGGSHHKHPPSVPRIRPPFPIESSRPNQVLLSRLHATAVNASAVSSAAARQRRLLERSQKERIDGSGRNKAGLGPRDGEDPSFRSDSPFPWGAAMVAVACGTVYFKLSNVVAVGMFVPVVNSVFFVGLAVFAFHKLKDKGALETGRRGKGHQPRTSAGGVVRKSGAWKGRRKGAVRGRGNGSTYLFG